jgi:hypothetical protein
MKNRTWYQIRGSIYVWNRNPRNKLFCGPRTIPPQQLFRKQRKNRRFSEGRSEEPKAAACTWRADLKTPEAASIAMTRHGHVFKKAANGIVDVSPAFVACVNTQIGSNLAVRLGWKEPCGFGSSVRLVLAGPGRKPHAILNARVFPRRALKGYDTLGLEPCGFPCT